MEYISERKFKIWEYLSSHSTLLIRSNKNYDTDSNTNFNYTIDVEFIDTVYIEIPITLDGILIKQATSFPERLSIYKNKYKIFEIYCGELTYYVVAWKCIVGQSEMDYDKNRYNVSGTNYSDILFDV